MSATPAARFDLDDIRRYYDRHTRAFIALGQGRNAGAIHRAVWGPGVRDREQAFHYVEDQIAKTIGDLTPTAGRPHIVDLGCGVGGSACYLAARLRIRVTGVTLSPVQARLAQQRAKAAGVSDRVVCIEGDYTNLPPAVGHADLAYAIESFVHAPSPDRFFEQCARLIRPGGVLVICDDARRVTMDPAASRAIERFCRGWHVNALLDAVALQTLARGAGFDHLSTDDLSASLELGRARDRAIDALGRVLEWLPVHLRPFGQLAGGAALQTCLARGWVGYDLVRFKRRA